MKLLLPFFSVLISCVAGLNEDALKEQRCIEAPSSETVGLDLDWFGSVETFYLPLWNQLYKARVAEDTYSKEARYINEYEINRPSCLRFNKDKSVFAFGRQIDYNITGDSSSITFKAHWYAAKSGTFQFHLTDNRNYVLGVTCWDDDRATYALLTTTPGVSYSTRRDILNYVKSVGFDEFKALDENYALCPGQNNFVRQPVSFPVRTTVLYSKAVLAPTYGVPSSRYGPVVGGYQ